ncbi:alcohol dehydrogenase [Aphanomyces cochlioides]|nr:alcohol dehydrogenase [Aphanomyces cochlioides]
MLRLVSRFEPSVRRSVTQSKAFSVLATSNYASTFTHGRACRCGNCSNHAPTCTCPRCLSRGFAVKSQSKYDIPKTQTAVVFEKNNAPLQVRKDWPVVQPDNLKPGQVLVRLAYSGVCHTDLHVWLGDWPLDNKVPLVGGHEGAGYVAAIGKNTQTKLKVGDPVGVKWLANSCLGCEDCRKGHEPTCEEAELHGFTVDGSFQQWCVSYADHVTPIPRELPLDTAAPILCAGVTVYKALKEFGGNAGDTVVIPVCSCDGIPRDRDRFGEEKRKLVASYGIQDFIDFKQGDVVEKVKALTGGRGAHGTIVVASSGDAYKQAIEFLRPFGSVIMVGLPKDTTITAGVFNSVLNSHRIIGSYVGNRQDAVEALKVAAYGDVKVKYDVENLSQLPSVYDRMAAGTLPGRIVLDCE